MYFSISEVVLIPIPFTNLESQLIRDWHFAGFPACSPAQIALE
jgi:hypothetical protein